MEYSKILETLLNITDQKLQDISDLLHYDKSYISKWANAKALPSISIVNEIHEVLSDYFAYRIYGTKKTWWAKRQTWYEIWTNNKTDFK